MGVTGCTQQEFRKDIFVYGGYLNTSSSLAVGLAWQMWNFVVERSLLPLWRCSASNSATVYEKCRFVFQILWYCTAKASLQQMHLYSTCRCDAYKTYNIYGLLIRRVYEDTAEEYFDSVRTKHMWSWSVLCRARHCTKRVNSQREAPLPERGQISNSGTIIWLSEIWLEIGQACKRNKINKKTTGYYTFLLGGVDDNNDLFQYLWGLKRWSKESMKRLLAFVFNVEFWRERTNFKQIREIQNMDEVLFRNFGQIQSLWVIRYIHLMTNFQGHFANNLTSMQQVESCGIQWWTIAISPIFVILV